MESTAADIEKVLESLRKTVEDDTNEKAPLKGKITDLEVIHSEVDKLKRTFTEVVAHADVVYQEYKKALVVLGAEPLLFP